MAINYPTSLDTFTNPTATDSMSTVSHSSQHSDINDAVEALEAKVGIGASTATDNTVLRGTGAGTTAFGQIDIGDIASGNLTGSDTTLVTGTAGSTDTLSVWNADGDIIAATVSADTPISVSSGAITIDGDHLDVDFTPTNYTPDSSPAEASDVDDLAAHLKGIDTAIGSVGGSKELFLQPYYTGAITTAANLGNYGYWLADNGRVYNFNIKIPADFTTLTSIGVICIADTTETVQWDLGVSFAAAGEVYTTNDTSYTNRTQGVTINEIEELDIDDGSVFTGIAAEDYLGVLFTSNTSDIRIIGLRFVYST